MIYSDDLIHANVNGVSDAYVASEMVILNTLREFGPDAKKLHEARKESKRQMDVLRRQVGLKKG